MQNLAAVSYVLALVYLANFFMLSAVASRQSGRSVWLFAKARGRQRWTASAFRAAFVAAFLWPAIRIVTGGYAGDPLAAWLEGLASGIVGHVLVAIGALIAAMSQYHMGASWRVGTVPGENGALVETGPFALSRNPVFVGQAILFVGLVLVFPDLVEAGAAAVAIAAMVLQVRLEEAALKADHGAAYVAYAARVPRWIGRVGG